LGVYLVICLWSAWILRPFVRRQLQLLLFAVMPLMVLGVFFTYTRSTWIGLIASGAIVGALQVPPRLRLPVFMMAALVGGTTTFIEMVCPSRARHSAIFAYSERPGVIGSPARTRQLFGRVTPAHLAAAARTVRVDELMD